MGLFTRKTNLSSDVTSVLVYETAKVKPSEIETLFDKIGAIYDSLENQVIVLTINIEIMRYSLQKSNSKVLLDNVINNAYLRFSNSLHISSEQQECCQNIINKTKLRVSEILFNKNRKSESKSMLVYRLIIDLENIHSSIIDHITEQEFVLTIENWFKQAKFVNDTYKIFDTEENQSNNAPIDFDF